MTTNWCPHPDKTKACGKCVAELVVSEERKAFYAIVDDVETSRRDTKDAFSSGWKAAFDFLRMRMNERLLGGK